MYQELLDQENKRAEQAARTRDKTFAARDDALAAANAALESTLQSLADQEAAAALEFRPGNGLHQCSDSVVAGGTIR